MCYFKLSDKNPRKIAVKLTGCQDLVDKTAMVQKDTANEPLTLRFFRLSESFHHQRGLQH